MESNNLNTVDMNYKEEYLKAISENYDLKEKIRLLEEAILKIALKL